MNILITQLKNINNTYRIGLVAGALGGFFSTVLVCNYGITFWTVLAIAVLNIVTKFAGDVLVRRVWIPKY